MGFILNPHRFASVSDGSLKASVPSCVFDLDATLAASYPGSGTSWKNIVSAPADGRIQSDYDFSLIGSPTFTGSAGSAAAYFALSGSNYFSLKSGVNTAFLKALHKTTNGADFWFAMALKFVAADNKCYMATNPSANDGGLSFRAQATGAFTGVRLRQSGAAGVSANSTADLVNGDNSVIVVSHSHSGNNTRMWLNSTTKESHAHTFSTTVADPTGILALCAETDGGNALANTTRVYAAAMGNAYIDDADAADIIGAYETRHGRDYTP